MTNNHTLRALEEQFGFTSAKAVDEVPMIQPPSLQPTINDLKSKRPISAEMPPGAGFRVLSEFIRISPEVIARLSIFESPDISDALNRMFVFDPSIHNLINDKPLFGPALTVKVFPGDNLMVHKALDVAQPGDVIVVDTGGSPRNAIIGDLIANKAKSRGVAGFIIDGLIRDLPGIKETGLPVFASGVTSFGPLQRGPGELGYPISCGGIVVNPGDAICADTSGIVVVRKEIAEYTIEYLVKHKAAQADYLSNVRKGVFSNEWVDRQLLKDGCVIE